MLNYGKEDVKLIFNNLGSLFNFSSYLFLIPIIIAFIYNEPFVYSLVYLFLAVLIKSFSKILKFKTNIPVERRHSVVVIILFWVLFSVFAAFPFFVLEKATFINALFESISSITNTGISLFPIQDALAYSSLFWRALLEWVGGIGFIILAIMGLFMTYSNFSVLAESAGYSDKLASNIKKTVYYFFSIYLGASLIGIFALRFVGLPLFDAIYYCFTAISSSGSDMTNLGLASYGNLIPILIVLLFIMIFGATSFITHYKVLKNKSFKEYFKDKSFIMHFILIISVFFFISLKFIKLIPFETLFYSISASTGGVSFSNISHFPEIFRIILIFLMFVGGSTASTAGGIKRQRLMIIFKSIWWKIKAFLLPVESKFRKRFNDKSFSDSEINEVYGFVLIYFLFILLGTIILMAYNFSGIDSLFIVTSTQGGIGLTFGLINASLPVFPKLMLMLNMIVGRLEIIPVLVLFGFISNIRFRRNR